jgi:hypothetical protein
VVGVERYRLPEPAVVGNSGLPAVEDRRVSRGGRTDVGRF